MSAMQAVGFVTAAYLALLARSAWKQGEFRQFMASLAVVAALIGSIAAAVWAAASFGLR
ncbi:hypothetical protein HL658_21135 [Azospirillum sp. RWY-5-1]|uniref:Uncharacterized protein n=1 Tax=Azospirillum oleiclasticum TaxID=2735135 RepID=A0ABX2TIC1_9PROT|nr:hypothetical protein [Azospirillum oleiclasticum]NYZ15057.1 hypothetical protein [Azospirillum oleiclasticum]NYZ22819.1 hypothetical protein [Azospirillum oleiclasticum]